MTRFMASMKGTRPIFIVSDPDFLQELFIKQFPVFAARKSDLPGILAPNIGVLYGLTWRRHRHIINPTFSAAKLKAMSPLINGCISDLMKKLPEHVDNGKEFNIYLYYKRMTMDVICEYKHFYLTLSSKVLNETLKKTLFLMFLSRCAFDIDTDLQNNSDNIYFLKVEEFFGAAGISKSLVFECAQLILEVGLILSRIFLISTSVRAFINTRFLPLVSSTKQLHEPALTWLINRLHTVVEQSQKTSSSRVDLLQLMLQMATKEKKSM